MPIPKKYQFKTEEPYGWLSPGLRESLDLVINGGQLPQVTVSPTKGEIKASKQRAVEAKQRAAEKEAFMGNTKKPNLVQSAVKAIKNIPRNSDEIFENTMANLGILSPANWFATAASTVDAGLGLIPGYQRDYDRIYLPTDKDNPRLSGISRVEGLFKGNPTVDEVAGLVTDFTMPGVFEYAMASVPRVARGLNALERGVSKIGRRTTKVPSQEFVPTATEPVLDFAHKYSSFSENAPKGNANTLARQNAIEQSLKEPLFASQAPYEMPLHPYEIEMLIRRLTRSPNGFVTRTKRPRNSRPGNSNVTQQYTFPYSRVYHYPAVDSGDLLNRLDPNLDYWGIGTNIQSRTHDNFISRLTPAERDLLTKHYTFYVNDSEAEQLAKTLASHGVKDIPDPKASWYHRGYIVNSQGQTVPVIHISPTQKYPKLMPNTVLTTNDVGNIVAHEEGHLLMDLSPRFNSVSGMNADDTANVLGIDAKEVRKAIGDEYFEYMFTRGGNELRTRFSEVKNDQGVSYFPDVTSLKKALRESYMYGIDNGKVTLYEIIDKYNAWEKVRQFINRYAPMVTGAALMNSVDEKHNKGISNEQ